MNNTYLRDLKVSYKYYVNYCRTHKKPVYVFDEYKRIVYDYLEFMQGKLFETGYFKLPRKFGQLEIIGRKTSDMYREDGKIRFRVDIKSTLDLWDRDEDAKRKRLKVYFTNDHTNGIYYSIKWNTNNYVIGNKKLYKFVPCRTLKRMLVKKIKEGKEYLTL